MTAVRSFIGEDLARVASDACWAFLRWGNGETYKLEDAQHGREMLELFERVTREIGEHVPDAKENLEAFEAYCAVRGFFFRARVRHGEPAYEEWSEGIHKSFRSLLFTLQKKVEQGLAATKRCLEGPEGATSEQVGEVREFFAHFSLWLLDLRDR